MRTFIIYLFIIFNSLGFSETAKILDIKSSLLVSEARKQVGVTLSYDPSYVSISYPGGDVAAETGVCTDVIVRALRQCNLDLQKAIHLDMKNNFRAYPQIWGLKRGDRNIDHRRVPNQRRYFERQGWSRPLPKSGSNTARNAAIIAVCKPGDIISNMLPGNIPHIMIVSDKKSKQGRPLVIHNIGSGCVEEDSIADYPINGHYRPKLSKKKLDKPKLKKISPATRGYAP